VGRHGPAFAPDPLAARLGTARSRQALGGVAPDTTEDAPRRIQNVANSEISEAQESSKTVDSTRTEAPITQKGLHEVAPPSLYKLIYCSRPSQGVVANADEVLTAILRVSRERNQAANVTGALLSCGGWFLQALEGSMTDVLGTFARILKDPRHDKVKLIERSTASKRLFLGWSMCGQHLESIDEHIVQSIESSGSFDPPTMTPAGALKLLVTVMTIQNKVR